MINLRKAIASFIASAAALCSLGVAQAQYAAPQYGGGYAPQGGGYYQQAPNYNGGGYASRAQYAPQQAPQQGPMQGGQQMSPEQYFVGIWRFETSMGLMITQFAPNGQYVSQFQFPNGQGGQGGGSWRVIGMDNGVFTLEIVNMQARKPARMKENYMPVDANTMRYGDGMGYRIG